MAPEPQEGPPGHLGLAQTSRNTEKSRTIHYRGSQDREIRAGSGVKKSRSCFEERLQWGWLRNVVKDTSEGHQQQPVEEGQVREKTQWVDNSMQGRKWLETNMETSQGCVSLLSHA